MPKRVTIVALIVVAAILVLAVPAMAANNGLRADYTVTSACAGCHGSSPFLTAPVVYPKWLETKHAVNEAYAEVAGRVPIGSVCQGCHTANFDPAKMSPVPTATATAYDMLSFPTPVPTATNVSWGAVSADVTGFFQKPAVRPTITAPQGTGNAAWSEGEIGCSTCHYGAGPVSDLDGRDVNDSAHTVPYGNMADAQICGACHSRYAYTKGTYAVTPIPYVKLNAAGSPIPNPKPTGTIQPQMAIGYAMLGSPSPTPAWSPVLSDNLVVPHPGWTPSPTATAAGLGSLQTYWQIDGKDSLWQQTGHDGSAAQYPEWASEGHAQALNVLKPLAAFMDVTPCLECHSADYRIAVEAHKTRPNVPIPTVAQTKYGITCVGCHAPHDAGTAKGRWDENFDAQLVGDPKNPSDLCTTCHNGEIPEGTMASPGAEIHHPMKEMMDGYGAIDVSAFPSVHKGKCVQCHMPPTSLSRGSVQLGGNHTFNIITPADANDASPIPYVTTAATATATPIPGGTPVITVTTTVWKDGMPFSACSTCHNNDTPAYKGPEPVAAATTTPTPGASPLVVKVDITQNANGNAIPGSTKGGDKAMWLQNTIEQRQSWTKMMVGDGVATGAGGFVITGKIGDALQVAAGKLGYANAQDAADALNKIPAAQWTTAQRAFLTSFTNAQFVVSEGSFGLHNWDYSREIVNKAMEQAKVAQTGVLVKLPWKVTLKLSKTSVKVNTKVTFSGAVKTAKGVAGAGQVNLMRLKVGTGAWKVWQRITLKANGTYSLTKKMTSKATWRFRAVMPSDSLNLSGSSTPTLKLVVK